MSLYESPLSIGRQNYSEGPRPRGSRRSIRWLRRSGVDIRTHVRHSCTRHNLLHAQFKILCSQLRRRCCLDVSRSQYRTVETPCQRRREHSDVTRLARYSESRLLRSSLDTHVHRHAAGRRQHGERDMARHFAQETSSRMPAPMKRPRAMWCSEESMATTTAFRSSALCKTT